MRFVEGEDRDRFVCESCGSIHYLNPKIVAGTIPIESGKVWLLRRAIEPRIGYWTFPAGYMELGETVEQAAARETAEELGLEIHIERLLDVYSWPHLTTVHIIYLAEALGTPTGGKETLEYRLFRPAEIPWDTLAFNSTHRALGDWVRLLG